MSCARVFAAAALALTAATSTAADRPMVLIHSGHTTIVGQQSARTLRGIALQLEQFRAVVGGLINHAQGPLPVPTTVYVFGLHKDFEPFIPLRNGKPASLGGYFFHDEEANTIALQLEGFEAGAEVVFHEYTHVLLHNAAAFIPLWLDEGLAEYYSTYALESDATRAAIGRPIERHVLLLREQFIPLSDLINVDHESPLYNERDRQSIFYAEVWALTHYLMNSVPDGAASINRYATAIARGAEPDAAFLQAFGKTPAVFERDLRSYVRQLGFVSRVFTLKDRLRVETPDAGRTLSAGEAGAWLGDLQRRAGRTDEAAVRIENAVAAAPAVARPLLAMARLRLAQHRLIEAWPAFERAAALAPGDFETQFAYAVALLRHDDDSPQKQDDAPAIERARTALLKATAANPSSSDAFAWLAYAEMMTDGRLTEAGAAIRRAMELAPGRLEYRLRYADVLMLAGALADARTMLTDVARVTTDTTIADAAKRRLAALDEQDARMRAAAEMARVAAERAAAAEAERRAANARFAGVDTAAQGSAQRELDFDAPRETEPGARPRLRAVQRGEERAYGDLVELECRASQVRIHVKVGSRVIVATAKRMQDLTVTSFLPDKNFGVACGTREPPDAVYLTWRPMPHRTEVVATDRAPRGATGATIVGEAVAMEFVPRGFTP
jgi:tetratricopeptide (TPR) repeat protein